MKADPHVAPASQAQERAWISSAKTQRSTSAFASLVGLHQARVRAVLRRLALGDHGLADDLAQECFLKAWLALPGFNEQAQFSTWLHRIAYREFLQHRRAAKARPLELDDSQALAIQTPGPDQTTHTALRLDLEKALARLAPLERAAVVYSYHTQLSHAQVAQVMGLPLGTVKSHVLRGREKLRQHLSDWAPRPAPEIAP